MPAFFAKSSLAVFDALLLPIMGGSDNTTAIKISAKRDAMSHRDS
jgi:hypothetical protein